MRPQLGDFIIFDEGPNLGEVVRPEMLELNQQPVSALAKDPETDTLRDGSRLNRVMITRIDPDKLTERYRANAADGVIAYSAICTHTGCDVINWNAEQLRMACPCHESQFDIYDGGKVVGGPAPRPLAMLPLEIVDGTVIVAALFRGRVGFTQQF
jgi:Rieske Fe-S protein